MNIEELLEDEEQAVREDFTPNTLVRILGKRHQVLRGLREHGIGECISGSYVEKIVRKLPSPLQRFARNMLHLHPDMWRRDTSELFYYVQEYHSDITGKFSPSATVGELYANQSLDREIKELFTRLGLAQAQRDMARR